MMKKIANRIDDLIIFESLIYFTGFTIGDFDLL